MSRRADDAVVTISVGELRAIVRAEIEAALSRSKTKPARKPKATENGAWSPAEAMADMGLRRSR